MAPYKREVTNVKFTIKAHALATVLKQAVRAAAKRSENLFSYFHIQALADELRITANNGELQISLDVRTSSLAVEVEGSCCIVATKLEQIVAALISDSTLTLSTDGEKATLKAGRSKFTIAVRSASDFPLLALPVDQTAMKLTASGKELREAIKGVSFAAGRGDVRAYLNGVLMDVAQGSVNLVGTNGHMLGSFEIQGNCDGEGQYILPIANVDDFANFLPEGEVTVVMTPSLVLLKTQQGTLTTKLIDGKYPNYKALLSGADKGPETRFKRDDMISALSRVSLMASPKSGGVQLDVSQQGISISAATDDGSDAEDFVSLVTVQESFLVGVNFRYALDILKSLAGEEISLKFNGTGSGTSLCGEQSAHRFVLMPMRL